MFVWRQFITGLALLVTLGEFCWAETGSQVPSVLSSNAEIADVGTELSQASENATSFMTTYEPMEAEGAMSDSTKIEGLKEEPNQEQTEELFSVREVRLPSVEINDEDYLEPTTLPEPPVQAFLSVAEDESLEKYKRPSWVGSSFSGTDEDWLVRPSGTLTKGLLDSEILASGSPGSDLSVSGGRFGSKAITVDESTDYQRRFPSSFASPLDFELDSGVVRGLSAVGESFSVLDDRLVFAGDYDEPSFLPEPSQGRDIARFQPEAYAQLPIDLEALAVVKPIPGSKTED